MNIGLMMITTKRMSALELCMYGFKQMKSMIMDKEAIITYILVLGVYDIAAAIYTTENPDTALLTTISWASNLGILFSSLIILVLSRKLNKSPSIAEIGFPKSLQILIKAWIVNLFSGILIVLGLIFFLIPGIILSLRFIYIIPASVLERLDASSILHRSSELSKVNRFSFIGACIFTSLIYFFVLFMAISIIIAITNETALQSLWFNYFSNLVSTIFTTWIAAIGFSAYTNAQAIYNASTDLET